MSKSPSKWDVLTVVRDIVVKQQHARSIYIGDRLREQGFTFSPPALLKRLRVLEQDGYVETHNVLHGYYGYDWSLTDKGFHYDEP